MQLYATIKMINSNPTQRTQEEILLVIKNSEMPLSLTAIAKTSNKDIYQVKKSIQFFEKLGIVKTIISSGNTTFVVLNKNKEDKNA